MLQRRSTTSSKRLVLTSPNAVDFVGSRAGLKISCPRVWWTPSGFVKSSSRQVRMYTLTVRNVLIELKDHDSLSICVMMQIYLPLMRFDGNEAPQNLSEAGNHH